MKRSIFFAVFCSMILSFSGCDLVDSVKNNFSKKESKAPAVVKSVQKKSTQGALPANVIIRIENWSLTKPEFEERLKALKEIVPEFDINDLKARTLVLDELVRQQLIVLDAEKTGLAQSKDIVAAVDEFRRTLLVREAARKITEGISVNEGDALKFYQDNKDQIVQPFEYRVSEIVIPDEVKANEIKVDLLKGGDFAEAARQFSISDSADAGGDLGFLKEDPFPAMVDAILALEQEEISSVFEGPEGFYIIKLDEKKGGATVPYEDVKEDIIQNRTLFHQQQAILDYIEGLRGKIKVEINEQLIP